MESDINAVSKVLTGLRSIPTFQEPFLANPGIIVHDSDAEHLLWSNTHWQKGKRSKDERRDFYQLRSTEGCSVGQDRYVTIGPFDLNVRELTLVTAPTPTLEDPTQVNRSVNLRIPSDSPTARMLVVTMNKILKALQKSSSIRGISVMPPYKFIHDASGDSQEFLSVWFNYVYPTIYDAYYNQKFRAVSSEESDDSEENKLYLNFRIAYGSIGLKIEANERCVLDEVVDPHSLVATMFLELAFPPIMRRPIGGKTSTLMPRVGGYAVRYVDVDDLYMGDGPNFTPVVMISNKRVRREEKKEEEEDH